MREDGNERRRCDANLDDVIEVQDVVRLVTTRRMKWFGHVGITAEVQKPEITLKEALHLSRGEVRLSLEKINDSCTSLFSAITLKG